MYNTVDRLFKNGKIDLSGLERAVRLNWITEEEKRKIINGTV